MGVICRWWAGRSVLIGGVGLAKTVTLIIGMPSRSELWSVAMALLVATAVGVFFGVCIRRARLRAKVDPIVALRVGAIGWRSSRDYQDMAYQAKTKELPEKSCAWRGTPSAPISCAPV